MLAVCAKVAPRRRSNMVLTGMPRLCQRSSGVRGKACFAGNSLSFTLFLNEEAR